MFVASTILSIVSSISTQSILFFFHLSSFFVARGRRRKRASEGRGRERGGGREGGRERERERVMRIPLMTPSVRISKMKYLWTCCVTV